MVIIPDHNTHEVVGVSLTPLVFAATYQYTTDINTSVIMSAIYFVSTFFFSPDLDTDSKPYYRWAIFSFIWWPYKTFVKHRSLLSHSGPFSGTLRFLYFMMFVVLLTYVFPFPLLTYFPYCVMLWISIMLVDSIHTLLDLLF